ncbi:MAG: cytochrome C [Betaproteobacteria bacterium]|nr:MAG: cytochrome C [Betaproteobacteria bacterium]
MFSLRNCFSVFIAALTTCAAVVNATPSSLGRPATPAEIKAWDIDVRPDFKGLPAGSGSVKLGQEVWEAKCESCHGVFGESNEVFTPIAGGTTKADMTSGRVSGMVLGAKNAAAQRTTLMKLSELSTLWDYINRAMPWNNPKTLTTEEVYAVTAYVLHLGDIVPADFVLSDKNIREVQKTLPNRNGKTRQHGLWNVGDKPDVQGDKCVANCVKATTIGSSLPDYARNAHGNLADQHRLIGAVRGLNTAGAVASNVTANTPKSTSSTPDPLKLAQQHACTACHGVANKLLGPSLTEIHKKYAGTVDVVSVLAAKIKAGGSGVWGAIPMPAQAHVPDADIQAIAAWLAAGKF